MSNIDNEKQKVTLFRQVHHRRKLLLLPNAWDVASARVFEEAGFEAIATTSAGIAFSLGYPDGERISRQQMNEVVARIAAAVKVPVTADVESGYGDRPEDAAETARAVISARAVGMNLEDSSFHHERCLVDLSKQLEKITAIREASQSGVSLVLNARTDIYLLDSGEPATRLDAASERLSAFRDAGDDVRSRVTRIRQHRRTGRKLQHPLNILARPGSPSIRDLEKLGVACVTLGSRPMRATLGLLQRMTRELKANGTYQAL